MKLSILTAVLSLALFAGEPQNPALAGSVEGIVRNAETREPIADVEVALAENFDATRTGMPSVHTDSNGRFFLNNIAPKTYTVIRRRFGYFPPKKEEWWEEQPKVQIRPSQHVTGVILELIPGGTISGRVVDANGDPVAGTRVFAAKPRYVEGKRSLNGSAADTDDHGRYRISGLFPGSYYLQAEYIPVRGGLVSSIVFFPDTFDEKAARTVQVQSGVEFNGMDFTFPAPATVPTFSLTGVVTGIPSNTKEPRVKLFFRDSNDEVERLGYHLIDDGRFQIRGLPIGAYDVYAVMEDEKRNLLTAKTPVNIQADTDGVSLSLQRGVNLRVRVTVDGAAPGAVLDDANPELVPVKGVFPTYYNGLFSILDGYRAERNSGEFVLPGIPPGTYKLKFPAFVLKNGYISDIRQSGRSVFDDGFTVGNAPPEPIEITISHNPGSLEGIVRDAAGKPAAHAAVVLAPLLARRNNPELFVKWTTDVAGKFSIPVVRPGAYKVFAWDDPPFGEPWQNADFMTAYESSGSPVQIESNRPVTIQLIALPRTEP